MPSEITCPLRSVPDDELLRSLAELVSQSRRVEADLVAHIGEVDARRLFARQAFPSMFAYCTAQLHLSEAEAYRRITVARAARKHPTILDLLREGRVHLSGLARIVPLLTSHNAEGLLKRATHLTTRQIEALVAELSPRPDVPAAIRKLPQRPTHSSMTGEEVPQGAPELVPGRVEPRAPTSPQAELVARRAEAPVVEALAPSRFKIQFTASAQLRDKLERLKALMRSEIPDGDLASVIERAVTDKLDRIEARRFGKTASPRTTLSDADVSGASRHIPAAVRRAVSERDGDRCRFVDEQGRRCSERQRLEFHHRHPFAMGGSRGLANISLLCREHNRRMAERDYGRAKVAGAWVRSPSPPTLES